MDPPSRSWHRLTNVDPEALTGDCSICGPGVSLKLKRRGSAKDQFRCLEAERLTPSRLHRNYYYEDRNRTRHSKVSMATRELMIEQQRGLCAICEKPMEKPQVDHCHVTGRVRGVLCYRCNLALGLFTDDHAIVARAVAYLRTYDLESWGKPAA